MKIRRALLSASEFLIAVSFLVSCASTPRITEVKAGMTDTEVRELLGAPQDKSLEGSYEKWSYTQSDGSKKVILFRGGKVTSLTAEKDGKIMPAIPEEVQITGKPADKLLCSATNEFGNYAEGGGCNMYGCWPPGGYCNGFGCTASGFCTNRGCPKKIKSFECVR